MNRRLLVLAGAQLALAGMAIASGLTLSSASAASPRAAIGNETASQSATAPSSAADSATVSSSVPATGEPSPTDTSSTSTDQALPPMVLSPDQLSFSEPDDMTPASVTVSGTGCRSTAGPASVTGRVESVKRNFGATPDSEGNWSFSFKVDPTVLLGAGPVAAFTGPLAVRASCVTSAGSQAYPEAQLAVSIGVPGLGSTLSTSATIIGSREVPAGSTVEVRGTNWANFDRVHVALHSAVVVPLATVATGEDGNFVRRVLIPRDTPLGGHLLVLTGERYKMTLSITVVAPQGLANSGAPAGRLAVVGLTLVALGVLLTASTYVSLRRSGRIWQLRSALARNRV